MDATARDAPGSGMDRGPAWSEDPQMDRLSSRALAALAAVLVTAAPLRAAGELRLEPADAHLATFGAGAGPRLEGDVLHLLDAEGTFGQSNVAAFDRAQAGLFARALLRFRLRVLPGGDGGAIAFLSTAHYGRRGPGPFVPSWVEPNLHGSFAVGLDVHDPPSDEPFGPWGNVEGLPEREVSLHWDGREICKRLAPAEFRGEWTDAEIELRHVVGGAEVTVRLAGVAVYEREFVAGLLPYQWRLAFGAGTRADVATEFDIRQIHLLLEGPTSPARPPLIVEAFDHVLTDNSRTAYQAEVELPPARFEIGRVVMTIEIHDAGSDWDEWDRNGEVSVIDSAGRKWGIVPFITSYRTPCHWEVDVTHFRPWLSGRTKLEIAAGTTFYKNRGFEMSVALAFYPGRAKLEPFQVDPLWVGTAHHGPPENHFQDFFQPRRVAIDPLARDVRLFLTTTGHSQVGEFTPARRIVRFRPDAEGEDVHAFENLLWKSDNYLNPNRPQFGTWKYPRAGWAPGDVVRPWWIELGKLARPGRTALFEYEPLPYDFSGESEPPSEGDVAQATHVIRAYLVQYREPTDTIPVPRLRVTNVVGGSEAERIGLRQGDWLASYDGVTLGSIEDLRGAIAAASESGRERVPLVAYRGEERIEAEVAPGRLGVQLTER